MSEVADSFAPRRAFRFVVDLPGLDFLVQSVNFPSMVGMFGCFRTEFDQPIEIIFLATSESELLIQNLLNRNSFDVPVWFLDPVGHRTGGWNLKGCRATLAPFSLNYSDSEPVKYTLLVKSPSIVAMKD